MIQPQLETVAQSYHPQQPGETPLREYAVTVGLFNALLGGLLWKGKAPAGKTEFDLVDMALMGVAAHKLSRVITKDVVTSPFRAPFTRFQEYLGYGEVNEKERGQGAQQVIGELISCNYCMDVWIMLGLSAFLEVAPKRGRFLLKFFSALAIADFLHVAYEGKRTQANVDTLREVKLEKEVA